MLDLIKFELYKIFSKKSVRIILLLTILLGIFNVVAESVSVKYQGVDHIDDVYNIMKEYEGKAITEESAIKAENTINDLKEKKSRGEKLTEKEIVYMNYLYDTMRPPYPAYTVNNELYTVDEMKDEMNKLKNENKTDTYEYKNLNFIYEKVKNVEEPKFYFSHGWLKTADFKAIATLITTLIAVGLAAIFSDEYQSNSAQIMLSCKYGKNKMVLSKMITGLIFTATIFIIINVVHMIGVLLYDFRGWDAPLELFKYYTNTPFDMRVIDFYITGLGISFIGAILYSLVTMLISLLVKNNMVALLLSLGLYYIPAFFGNFIPMDSVGRLFREMNLAEAISIEGMFVNSSTYNILGKPVMYSTLLISLVAVFIPIIMYLIKYFGKKQTI
ncbi:ABC transporter permease subunit [Terrisporobacter hibernicus]|uniref:ABC transporter permease subunit n=1 Tax=Terrisporobacter hibernicus TaxID=2813371 RepID=A0AAX2ZBR1_9FIRM|nr:ABC transporter permease subunit [Terrisporobacter hibernicus]UEL46075.1 ABC transporter permease subunit [Terrisporobacter hibernicus]